MLRELIFLRAQRLSGLAARRLLGSRPGTVLEGSELQATELLERHGLAFAADCFFRDPNLWAVAEARRRRQGRRLRRRLCRLALLGLLLALAGEPRGEIRDLIGDSHQDLNEFHII